MNEEITNWSTDGMDGAAIASQLRDALRRIERLKRRQDTMRDEFRRKEASYNEEKEKLQLYIRKQGRTMDVLRSELRVKECALNCALEKSRHQVIQKNIWQEPTFHLLETGTKGLQTFLTKADTFLVAEVARMVEALNSEIFQTASMIIELLTFYSEYWATEEEFAYAKEQATHILGSEMVAMLTAEEYYGDPASLVQNALQACLVFGCYRQIDKWSSDSQLDRFLSRMHLTIQETGELFDY